MATLKYVLPAYTGLILPIKGFFPQIFLSDFHLQNEMSLTNVRTRRPNCSVWDCPQISSLTELSVVNAAACVFTAPEQPQTLKLNHHSTTTPPLHHCSTAKQSQVSTVCRFIYFFQSVIHICFL